MHYLLFYEVSEDYVSKRAQFREEHLKKAWKASERGELVMAGALANPIDGALLLFKGDSPEVAENFARTDPYVTNGLVKRWYVREWTTVAGKDAATPIRPDDSKPAGGSLSSPPQGVILRMWKAHSTVEKTGDYVRHATTKVFPALRTIKGYRGAYLLRRALRDRTAIELVVLTLWESMEAIRRFAGEELDKAVVEPEARAALTSFDDHVAHFEVIYRTENA